MNRRIRNRTSGGVGGRREQSRLLPDPARFTRLAMACRCDGANDLQANALLSVKMLM